MVCSPPIGPEIVRGSITRDRWNITLRLSYANEVPLGQLSHLYLKIDWQPDQGVRDVDLIFSAQAPQAGGGQIVFNDANGTNTRRFSGDIEQLVAIYGKSQSPAGATDVTLEVKIDDEVRHRIPLAVRPVPAVVPAATAFERLRQEMAIAALATRPTDAAQQKIWDRYTRIFDDARAIADKLGTSLPTPVVPTIQGTLTNRALTVAEIVEHLRSHRSPTGLANNKAKNRTDAFDPFKGHWRGDWRQINDCGIPVNTCQDHLWGATEALPSNRDIYLQQVELGPDSRPYTATARTCTAIREVGRDSTLQAINAINIKTGVIVGAVGVRATADADGLWSSRPHVGFYIAPGRLLWLAEENRSSDSNTVTYSLFYELREGDPVDQPLYTILAFDGSWNRTNQTFTANRSPKAAQYLKIMTDAERQLERQFRDRQLQPQHRQDPYFLRQLESLNSATVQAFLSHAADSTPEKAYLERLLDFVSQQEALRDAPLGTREAVTFILGDIHGDEFYEAANNFFTQNPDGDLVTNLRSLQDVRDHLNFSAPSGAPWGRVNIVSHANEEGGMQTPVATGGLDVNPERLEKAIDDGQIRPLPDAKLDVRSEIRIRGCSLGQSQRMLRLLSQAFGGDEVRRPMVRAPKHLQVYRWRTAGPTQASLSLVETEEYLEEFWFVGWPGTLAARPNRATLVTLFRTKYPTVDIDWDRALRGQIPNITEDVRDRSNLDLGPVDLDFTTDNEPNLGTTSATRLAWLRANTNADAQMAEAGHTFDDYAWTFDINIQNLGGNQRHLTLTAHGVRWILRLQRPLRGRVVPQFSIDVALQPTLANRVVSPELIAAFDAHSMALSDKSEIWIWEVNRRWMIIDPINVHAFLVTLANGQLTVGLEQDFLNTEPVVHAHPPATDLRHFGEEIPARPAQHPLGENVQP